MPGKSLQQEILPELGRCIGLVGIDGPAIHRDEIGRKHGYGSGDDAAKDPAQHGVIRLVGEPGQETLSRGCG